MESECMGRGKEPGSESQILSFCASYWGLSIHISVATCMRGVSKKEVMCDDVRSLDWVLEVEFSWHNCGGWEICEAEGVCLC